MKFAAQTHVKIPISSLFITDNVRLNYDEEEILQLAQSIRNDGLLNPITVRPPIEVDCVKKYEIIAGHRRFLAIKKLCENGDDFSMVECCIRSGEKLTLQIVENIQRTDLSSREKEEAIQKMLDTGLSQTEISERLAKPLSFISDTLAGAKVRKLADDFGFNTENITTKTLSQLRSVPEENIQSVFQQLINMGGTYRAATLLKDSYKQTLPDNLKAGDDCAGYSPKDESKISPKEISEKEFYSENENNSTFSKEVIKWERFAPGTIITHAGKRLFFKELCKGKEFVHATCKTSHMYLRVCKIVEISEHSIKYIDGDKSCGGYGIKRDSEIDSVKESHIDDWIFQIPYDAQDKSVITTHASSNSESSLEVENSRSGGVKLYQLNQFLRKVPSNTPLKILFDSKLYEVFLVKFDEKNKQVIFSHEFLDVGKENKRKDLND